MNVGHIISGSAHAGLIGWLLVGGWVMPSPPPVEITEVAIVSTEEYNSIIAAQQPPGAATEVEAPEAPAPEAAEAPEVSDTTDVQPESAEPEVTESAEPDTAPEQPDVTPPAPAEVADEAPVIEQPSQDVAVLQPAPQPEPDPAPRDVPRVAPTPVARPEPDVKVDEQVQEPVVRDEAAPAPDQREEQEATAPEEATTEIVTEADKPKPLAPSSSIRPKSRPPVQTAAVEKPAEKPTPKPAEKPAEKPAPKPAETAAEKPAPKPAEKPAQTAEKPAAAPKPGDKAAINDALAKALGQSDAPRAPAGPPLTGGEKEALRVAVSNCWNTGSLSSEALRITVVVGVSMSEDARPVAGTIRLISSTGGSDAAAKQAFEAARRAIIRCGASGYSLPVEKYDHWRDIEMTFNPEKMRIK